MYIVFCVDDSKVNSDYFLHWLNSHEAQERIRGRAQGSVRESVSFEEFADISIPLPALLVQDAVASYLNAVRRELVTLREYQEKLRAQKRGLMQKLIGRNRRAAALETEVA